MPPMGTLYLVRHGQASFGADDYDQLSDLGRRQSLRLGEYFAQKGVRFDGLIAGALRRHKQTMAAILEGMIAGVPLTAAEIRPKATSDSNNSSPQIHRAFTVISP